MPGEAPFCTDVAALATAALIHRAAMLRAPSMAALPDARVARAAAASNLAEGPSQAWSARPASKVTVGAAR